MEPVLFCFCVIVNLNRTLTHLTLDLSSGLPCEIQSVSDDRIMCRTAMQEMNNNMTGYPGENTPPPSSFQKFSGLAQIHQLVYIYFILSPFLVCSPLTFWGISHLKLVTNVYTQITPLLLSVLKVRSEMGKQAFMSSPCNHLQTVLHPDGLIPIIQKRVWRLIQVELFASLAGSVSFCLIFFVFCFMC